MALAPEFHDRIRHIAQRLSVSLDEARSIDDVGHLQSEVNRVMQQCLDDLEATGCTGRANQLPSSQLWRVAEPVLQEGSLQLRARTKPLGYPGDHELLDRICREEVRGRSIGRAMDVFFQNQAAPTAVRNRGRETAATILRAIYAGTTTLKIASVGSGPAWDVRWALESMPPDERRRVDVTLVDLDPRALAFCEQQLQALLPQDNLHLERANLKRLPRLSKLLEQLAESDIVCCPGYFDYLNEAEAVTMLRSLWTCVASQGELLVFNFSQNNPSRAYMEWIGNWYLHARTMEAMDRLAATAELVGGHVDFGVEPAGVNLFLRVRKHDARS